MAGDPAVEAAFRDHFGRVFAAVLAKAGDFQLAEDAMGDAFEAALRQWPADGVPDNPAGWLTTVARRRAIDRLRRNATLERKLGALVPLTSWEAAQPDMEANTIPDERLRLIFTCCHPALPPEARVALTLRTLGGLTTAEIAAAFLVPEATMAQRLVRAKRKIRTANIPYRVPTDVELPSRLPGVLAVLYLLFNEGYEATAGDSAVRVDLIAESLRLCDVLATQMPDEAEALGLLALIVLHHARRDARVEGESLVLLADQDRCRWRHDEIQRGRDLVRRALRMGQPGPYQLQAAIAAVHAEAPSYRDTDWEQIVGLYNELARVQPGPVVALNHAVAVAMAQGPEVGLGLLDGLEEELTDYRWYWAARAELLQRAGLPADAARHRALELTMNDAERRHHLARLASSP